MLRSMQELKHYTIGATDGEIGHVTDFFFDDQDWVIRYLVVETGSWLLSRKVLITPYSLLEPDWLHKRLPVRINRDQLKNSPDIDTAKPVSHQQGIRYADFHGDPYYWGGAGMLDADLSPAKVAKIAAAQDADDDPHLRSCQAVMGYYIHASDGDIGHVQGMLVDEATWTVRYLVVDTTNWWGGHQVLVAPKWIESISWADSKVNIDLDRQAIQGSPLFDSTAELNRQYEMDLYRHYRHSAYWDQESSRETPHIRDTHDL